MAGFEARCDACNKLATFTEGSREKRRPDFGLETIWYFECGNCRARTDKLVDPQGVLHKWTGNRHVAYKPGT